MDYLQFVNSKDIRKHLRGIGYVPDTLQSAWLVWQAKGISSAKRHEAWNEIIRTMPDCSLPERLNSRYWPSVHQLLRELIQCEDECFRRFREREAGVVYSYIRPGKGHMQDRNLYSSLDACMEAAMECCRYDSDGENTFIRIDIRKQWADEKKETVVASFLQDGQWSGFRCWGYKDLPTEHDRELIYNSFFGLWFHFPTPFVSGDILYNPFDSDVTPVMVTEEVPLADNVERWKENGDYSDMVVHGYFAEENGNIFYECEPHYMDFEYFRGKLPAEQRILGILSRYFRKEIDIGLLLNGARTQWSREYTNWIESLRYADEGLRLAGILHDEIGQKDIGV